MDNSNLSNCLANGGTITKMAAYFESDPVNVILDLKMYPNVEPSYQTDNRIKKS